MRTGLVIAIYYFSLFFNTELWGIHLSNKSWGENFPGNHMVHIDKILFVLRW